MEKWPRRVKCRVRETSVVKGTFALAEDLRSVPSNHRMVKPLYLNSSSRQANTLFWISWVLYAHGTDMHAGKIFRYKIKINKSFFNVKTGYGGTQLSVDQSDLQNELKNNQGDSVSKK